MQNKQTILQNWSKENVPINEIIDNIFNLINLDDVKMKKNVIEISRNTFHATPSEKWFYALKIISVYSVKNNVIFSQSQLYDLLTIMSRIIDEKKKDLVNTITFNIYRDIMENYNKLNENIKLIFPVIIVNLMYIIKYGQDIEGNSVNLFAINSYYQNSKINLEDELKKILSFKLESSSSIQDIQDNKLFEISEKLTGRNGKEIQNAFQNLIEPDRQKIENVCRNYHKLQEYSELIETDGFIKIIEKEAGRKLSVSQLQHAANSIKKTKIYLENILDGSFVPKGKHGINHVKHNLEYGFQLMGIIQSKRRKIIIDNNN
ncbi:MAG: hypothetical protein MUO21_07585 [Nitrososphaeraceae archaeon]|nr:hypothetical protein [Nitrososphaeraceae archaeon]